MMAVVVAVSQPIQFGRSAKLSGLALIAALIGIVSPASTLPLPSLCLAVGSLTNGSSATATVAPAVSRYFTRASMSPKPDARS